MHGGNSPGPPIIHGRYSIAHRQSLQTKMQQFLADPNPGDLLGELALMRSLLQDFLDRYEDPVPMGTDAHQHIINLVETIGRLVDRAARIRNATALTNAEVAYLIAVMQSAVTKYIDDPDKRAAFVAELRSAIGLSGQPRREPAYIDAEINTQA